jgi:glycine/D-amino acid oxidase-like deaminating enzyme/nitrite reductase/ring-hydroxylating ferredoxin subunit
MNVEQERSRSPWLDVPPLEAPPMTADERADVVVIGAGIAGLSTAYELALQGKSVVVLDRGRFARGQTARTTAHLTFTADDYYRQIEKKLGEDAARAYYQSQSAAVDRIEQICAEEKIACDFARLDGVWVAADEDGEATLREELEAARRAGFTDVQWLAEGPGPFRRRPALRCPRQARFHPLKYLDGLIGALRRMGARLYDETAVNGLNHTDDGVMATCVEGGPKVYADQAVVATNTPIHQTLAIHTKQAPYRTYVIAAPVPKGSVEDLLIWDTLEPYHYLRIQPGPAEDLLIVGGEDHKSGTVDDGFDRIAALEAWARARYPQMGKVRNAWSGQVYEPNDYVPFIGQSPEHEPVFLVTGDSGQGITTGVAAGLVLRDLMDGRENPWAELYDPSRKPARRLGDYLKENLSAVKGLAEHLIDPDGDDEKTVESVEALAPGEGGLVRDGARLVAAYRDPKGGLHLRSAACTHVGCAVHFNSFETCWDCPCHGSQFSVDGEPLNAPAFKPLAAADQPADRAERRAPQAGATPTAV